MTLPNGEPLRFDMGPDVTWDGTVPERFYPRTSMATSDTNRIEIVITPEQRTELLETINTLRQQLSCICPRSLTGDERRRLFKLGDERKPFDAKSDAYLHQRPDLRSPTIDLAAYDTDGAAFRIIGELQAALTGVTDRLDDTALLLGADRMQANLSNYHYIEFMASQGKEGAAAVLADLKSSYPGRPPARAQAPSGTAS